MADTCTITREIGSTMDPVSAVETPIRVQVYPALATGQAAGKCRVQAAGGYGRNADPTPADPVLMRYRVLQLPVLASLDVRKDDQVVMVSCVNDPDLVGVHMYVRDQDAKSEATSRRLGIEERTG